VEVGVSDEQERDTPVREEGFCQWRDGVDPSVHRVDGVGVD